MKKSKIIALLMATACLTTVFAGCKDEVDCTKHVDGDKDGSCDTCGQAIQIVVEQLPAEEEAVVDMVVNPLPADSKISEYIGPKAEVEEDIVPLVDFEKTTVFDKKTIVTYSENLFYLTEQTKWDNTDTPEVEEDTEYKHTIYDAAAKKELYSGTSGSYYTSGTLHEEKSVKITMATNYIKVVEQTDPKDSYSNLDATAVTKFFTRTGELITSVTEENLSYDPNYEGASITQSLSGDYAYLTVTTYNEGKTKNTVYTVDTTTQTKVTLAGATGDKETFIKRPEFDVVKGNYGYVYDAYEKEVWVYDLTQWISCIYYNKASSNWEDVNATVLDNGKILVQYKSQLMDNAVNYDIIEERNSEYTAKFDVVQLLINPADGAMEEVELGYIFNNMGAAAAAKYNDNAKNLLYLTPIVDKKIDESLKFEAVLDDSLNILYAHKATVVGQEIGTLKYVAEGLYKTTLDYGDDVTVNVFVDGTGKELMKIPTNAEEYYGHYKVGTGVYSYTDMNTKLFDLSDYTVVKEYGSYVLLETSEIDIVDPSDTVYTYYYFNETMSEPQKVADTEERLTTSDYGAYWLQISRKVNVDESTTKTVYDLYNANGVKIETSDEMFNVNDRGYVVSFSVKTGEDPAKTVYYIKK